MLGSGPPQLSQSAHRSPRLLARLVMFLQPCLVGSKALLPPEARHPPASPNEEGYLGLCLPPPPGLFLQTHGWAQSSVRAGSWGSLGAVHVHVTSSGRLALSALAGGPG